MSLILDALRKSEAERRRGLAPDLLSPGPVLSRPLPRRRGGGKFALFALAVLAFAAVAWFVYAPAPEVALVPNAEPTLADDIELTPGSTPANPASTLPPMPTRLGAPPPKTPPAMPVIAAVPANMTPPAPVPHGPAEPAATPEIRPIAPVAVTMATDSALPGIALLPPELRSAMPPLKISMHVWSEQPAERFAIIDGQRVGEGARVPGGVVAEIRRDGVVLDVDGHLYLLPRP